MFGQQNGAPSGPMLLLRSLGFDPDQIRQQVEVIRGSASQAFQYFDQRLNRIDGQLEALAAQQREILSLLRDKGQ